MVFIAILLYQDQWHDILGVYTDLSAAKARINEVQELSDPGLNYAVEEWEIGKTLPTKTHSATGPS